jgi:hypothetical protein
MPHCRSWLSPAHGLGLGERNRGARIKGFRDKRSQQALATGASCLTKLAPAIQPRLSSAELYTTASNAPSIVEGHPEATVHMQARSDHVGKLEQTLSNF